MQGIATLPYDVQTQPVIPVGGVETMQSAARMLADFGREGDTYIVHAAEGETVIPKEVLASNPKLKEDIFKQMRAVGIEEPESYIVGDALNSRNPIFGVNSLPLKLKEYWLSICVLISLGEWYNDNDGDDDNDNDGDDDDDNCLPIPIFLLRGGGGGNPMYPGLLEPPIPLSKGGGSKDRFEFLFADDISDDLRGRLLFPSLILFIYNKIDFIYLKIILFEKN